MFSKQPKETKKTEITQEIEDLIASPHKSIAKQDEESIDKLEPNKSELVNSAEKISGIVSPYFIVLIGLLLYEDNFLIGTLLISIGILSLLKISLKDVATFFEWLQSLLGLSNK
jgi:hypothetical protein